MFLKFEMLKVYCSTGYTRRLIVMPPTSYKVNIGKMKVHRSKVHVEETMFSYLLHLLGHTSHPVVIICGLIFFAGFGKLGSLLNDFLIKLRNKNDIYAFQLDDLVVPNKKQLRYKLTKMIVDETDTLVCAYNNGAIYVWDLYNTNCSHYIDRRSREVKSLKMHRSYSTKSLPDTDDLTFNEPVSREKLPRAVWCMALKSSVLVVGCDKGSIEVYSLENECLQSFHQHEVESGVVSAKVISCLRFVVAFKYGQVEFYRLRPRQPTHNRTSSLPKATQLSCVIEVCRSLKVTNQSIIAMELAVDKLFIASLQGQVKVLRASDDGGIPMYSNITRDQEVSVVRTVQVPEMALIGTSSGNVHVLNSIGQTIKTLCCGTEEVMSITSDDDYIAVLAYDGVLTVWLKEGYIKWWQVNLISYGGAYEIVSLAHYSLAALNMESAIILNIVSRTIVRCIVYRNTPSISLVMSSPIASSNKSAVSIPSSESIVYQLKFPKLVDRNR